MVLATALLGATPLVATAAPRHDSAPVRISAAAAGVVYGGVTSQDFPVVIETSKNGRKAKAIIAIRVTCTSGDRVTVPDGYTALGVSKSRKFSASFGPETSRNDDGTTTDFEGSISGSFNKARTKVSGTWQFKATEHDSTGAVTDTCDSGSVRWTAKQ